MPSVNSVSMRMPLPSSTVITPSLPTFSMTSAIISPTSGSSALIDATEAISCLAWTGRAWLRSSSTMTLEPRSRPRLRLIGSAPAAMLRMPSRTIAWASTVAVVVPSPATSLVRIETSLASCAPMFWNGSSSSISRAMVTPSLMIRGAPYFLSSTTLRPLGPSVTRTALASASTPPLSARRAVISKASCLADHVVRSFHRPGEGRLLWAGPGEGPPPLRSPRRRRRRQGSAPPPRGDRARSGAAAR